MRTIRRAWEESLYGPDGRFTRGHRDFSTALTDPVTSEVLCRELLRLVQASADTADRADGGDGADAADGFTVVDVGAGTGAFLQHVAAHGPAHWQLVAVERAPRPEGLDPRIVWVEEIPQRFEGFLLAHEWLDDVPLDIVAGGRLLLEDGSAGPDTDPAWVETWGGDEDGSARDEAWRAALSHLEVGVALAIDYGHTRTTRRRTLTGWRSGRPCPPAYDGSCDLTAHVALDSLAAAVPGSTLASQRDALAGITPIGLQETSALRALRDPDTYGSYGWVQVRRGRA